VNTPFERTLRSLDAERRRLPFAMVLGVVLLGVWLVWGASTEVSVHIASAAARVEAREPVHVLRAEVGGRLVAAHAALGQAVRAGEVIFELDPRPADIRLAEATARAQTLAAEREVVEAAIDAAVAARASGEDVLEAALAEARARLAQARSGLAQADREVARVRALGASVAAQERERASAAAAERRAEVGAVRALAERLGAEAVRAGADRTAAIEQLRQEGLRLMAAEAAAEADARAAEHALEQRRVRAPIDGRLGELTELRPGDVVQASQPLGAIVPVAELRVVAHFPAERALGWLHGGAAARLRLDAFPWTWFGQADLVVKEVALEPRDGLVRVELEVTDPGGLALRHGLTGVVEVQVDAATPLALLLRAAGRRDESAVQPPHERPR